MKTEEIFELWDKDSKIDISELALESLKIPELHNKYYKIYHRQRLLFIKLQKEHEQLVFDKKEFFTLGPNEETKSLGWELPERGKILKSEVQIYLDADKDVVASALKVAAQKEKVDLLKSILDTISNRSYHINNAINFLNFQNGK